MPGPTPTHYAPVVKASRGDPTMRADVDIMGIQRGAHKDGPEICSQFIFKIPGGSNEDGTTLWGWNDKASAYCARCKQRDIDHVIIKDWTEDAMQRDREKFAASQKAAQAAPAAPKSDTGKTGDATAANPSSAYSRTYVEPVTPMQVFELEPGVPDPLAINAYNDAAKERDAALKAQREQEQVKKQQEAQMSATLADAARASVADDENERFKAEVRARTPLREAGRRGQRGRREHASTRAREHAHTHVRQAQPLVRLRHSRPSRVARIACPHRVPRRRWSAWCVSSWPRSAPKTLRRSPTRRRRPSR